MSEDVDGLNRLEGAVIDLATIVTKGSISRPKVVVDGPCAQTSDRFSRFVASVREERSS